jgi:hypothetical protein
MRTRSPRRGRLLRRPKRRRFCALGVARKSFIILPRLLHISFRVTVLGDPHKHSADYLWCFPNGPQRLTALGPFFRPGDIIAGVALANLAEIDANGVSNGETKRPVFAPFPTPLWLSLLASTRHA